MFKYLKNLITSHQYALFKPCWLRVTTIVIHFSFFRFHYAARTWEAVKKSQLMAEYNRLLHWAKGIQRNFTFMIINRLRYIGGIQQPITVKQVDWVLGITFQCPAEWIIEYNRIKLLSVLYCAVASDYWWNGTTPCQCWNTTDWYTNPIHVYKVTVFDSIAMRSTINN